MADAATTLPGADAMPYAPRETADRPSRLLFAYSLLLACATLALLLAGAMVTSTDAGLSVPDWPTTYGQNMFTYPYSKWVGGIFYEHSHRLIASSVGFLTIGLAVWLAIGEKRRWLRRLGWFALLAVIVQGVLGGLTVRFLLPVPVSVGHAGLAQLFFCTVVSIAVFLSPSWRTARPRDELSRAWWLRRLCIVTTVLIYVQILLGAVMRHTESGLAIPDFPLSHGRVVPRLDAASMDAINVERRWGPTWLPQVTAEQVFIHYMHRVGALVVTLAVLTTATLILTGCRRQGWLRRPAALMLAILPVQIALGAITIWSLRDKIPNSAHVVVGAALLATSLVLTFRVWRVVPSRRGIAIAELDLLGVAA